MKAADTAFNLWMWLDVRNLLKTTFLLLPAHLEGFVYFLQKNRCIEDDIDKAETLFNALLCYICGGAKDSEREILFSGSCKGRFDDFIKQWGRFTREEIEAKRKREVQRSDGHYIQVRGAEDLRLAELYEVCQVDEGNGASPD